MGLLARPRVPNLRQVIGAQHVELNEGDKELEQYLDPLLDNIPGNLFEN